jgi:hypothetical protein
MKGYERQVALAVAACEVVTYIVTPNYFGTGALPVTTVSMSAVGNRGLNRVGWVENERGS